MCSSDTYYIYATAIVVVSLISLTAAVYSTRQMQRSLRDTTVSSDVVTVVRRDGPRQVISTELVPGDVIEVPAHGCVLHCDAVLLQVRRYYYNESECDFALARV